MMDWLASVAKAIGIGAVTLFVALWILLLGGAILATVIAWLAVQYVYARNQWNLAKVIRTSLRTRRPTAVIVWALGLHRLSKGPGFWPTRCAYRLMGAKTLDQRQFVENQIALLYLARREGAPEPSVSSWSVLWPKMFPRWKLCVLLFFGLTVITGFVTHNVGWVVFCIGAIIVFWRGYRDPTIPMWGEVLRVGLLGVLIGSAVYSLFAAPLQRNWLVRLSRDVDLPSPDSFLCCIWDGKSVEPKEGHMKRTRPL
jgi:hypothetical protein